MTTYKDPDFNQIENVAHYDHFHDVDTYALTGNGEDRSRPMVLRYALYGAIPTPPTPSRDRVRAYVAARRYLAAHYAWAETHWDRKRQLQSELAALEQEQAWRATKTRQREIARLTARMEALEASVDQDVLWRVDQASRLCQSFRQECYGCWFGSRSRRDWADNWARSYGRCIGVVAPAERATLTDPAVLAYTDPTRAQQLALALS